MNNKPLEMIVGFAGYRGSKKFAIADALTRMTGLPLISMSALIAADMSISVPPPVGQHDTPLWAGGPTYRELLIDRGAARRQMNPTYWADLMHKQASDACLMNGGAVICGVRSLAELALVRQMSGSMIWVDGGKAASSTVSLHSAPVSLRGLCDHVLDGSRTIADAIEFLRQIGIGASAQCAA
jgi:hypothetical protein